MQTTSRFFRERPTARDSSGFKIAERTVVCHFAFIPMNHFHTFLSVCFIVWLGVFTRVYNCLGCVIKFLCVQFHGVVGIHNDTGSELSYASFSFFWENRSTINQNVTKGEPIDCVVLGTFDVRVHVSTDGNVQRSIVVVVTHCYLARKKTT